MKKTYITTVPDQIGAFLKASECFASLGINMTRISYNKAVDVHTLFIDVEGEPEQLKKAEETLGRIGYLQAVRNESSVALLEFMLQDVPGGMADILRLIQRYQLNISYISSQESGSLYQAVKVGLFVENEEKLKSFIDEARNICPVKRIDNTPADRVLDNSIFYQSFVSGLMRLTGLPEEKRDVLLVNSNLVMQNLDDIGQSPFRTFANISRFAEILSRSRAESFRPRITKYAISGKTRLTMIEPPCGSNTAILQSGEETLFIDCGYALYREEMLQIFRSLLPDFDQMKKRIIITHADPDHCGLLSLFDEVFSSRLSKECLELEYSGGNAFREQNPLHKPYVSICKALTLYQPPDPAKITALWDVQPEQTEPLAHMGSFDFGDMHFEVYQGKGGHLPGETVLMDFDNKVAFTGDIYINVHGMIPEQAEHNKYAPVLMTSVDTDPALCAEERAEIMKLTGSGHWNVFGAHGGVKEL